MKWVVAILVVAAWAYGLESYINNLPLSHNPIMQFITQPGWMLFGFTVLAISIIIKWLGRDWQVNAPRGRHISAPNPEARNSTYPFKKK